jgi:4-amino-4-deoxy-L-arabinose transferase-like glycosyltransferase
MMAGGLILNVEARLAKTDAALLASILIAQYALARAYIGYQSAKVGWPVFFAFWTALAAGILIKGPIILLIVLSTLLWLWITEKNLKWFGALKPVTGILYALLLIAPWFVAIIFMSNGAFVTQAGGHDLLAKLWESQGHKYMPFGVYLLAFPFTFFPFALWALLAVPDVWQNRREPAVRFCLGWLVPSWIVFEMAFTKLPHYVMPLYPAIALLAAKFLLDGYPALATAKKLRWLKPVAIGIWLVTGAMLLSAAAVMPYLMDHAWNPGFIATGILVLIAQIASLMLFFNKRESGALVMTGASLILMTNLFGNALPHLQHMWVSREIVRAAESVKPCPRALKIASTYNEPSLVFLAGTDTQLLNDGRAITDAMRKDLCVIGVVDEQKKQAFLDAFVGVEEPAPVATIEGVDTGGGHPAQLTLYLQAAKK